MTMIAIYKIPNQRNNKPYIGQTRQPNEKRFLRHAKAHMLLGGAMRECGLENFTIEIIKRCETQPQANERERFRICVLNCRIPNGYNRSNGGEVHVHIEKHPQKATVMKLGDWLKMYRTKRNLTMQDLAST